MLEIRGGRGRGRERRGRSGKRTEGGGSACNEEEERGGGGIERDTVECNLKGDRSFHLSRISHIIHTLYLFH